MRAGAAAADGACAGLRFADVGGHGDAELAGRPESLAVVLRHSDSGADAVAHAVTESVAGAERVARSHRDRVSRAGHSGRAGGSA
ncbi:MAG TPA: hypothetical protein VF230_00240 [Acidimicrobiales bacterium]